MDQEDSFLFFFLLLLLLLLVGGEGVEAGLLNVNREWRGEKRSGGSTAYRHAAAVHFMAAFRHALPRGREAFREITRGTTEWEQGKVDDTARNCMLSAAPTRHRAGASTVDAHLCLAHASTCACVRAYQRAFVNEWPIRLPVSRGPRLTALPGCTRHKGRLRPPTLPLPKLSLSTLPRPIFSLPFLPPRSFDSHLRATRLNEPLRRSKRKRERERKRRSAGYRFSFLLLLLFPVTPAAREKSAREDGQREEIHSPSLPPQKISAGGQSRQGNCTRGASELHKAAGSAVCSASGSDSGSPLPAHYLKPESEDGSVNGGAGGNGSCGRAAQEEQNDAASSNAAGNRCIAGVFAGHGEVKSVLGTVVKFATGISPDTGDTVLTLVLALLVNPSFPLLLCLSSFLMLPYYAVFVYMFFPSFTLERR